MVTIVKSKEATAMTALDSIFGTQSADSIFLPSQPYALKLNCKSGQIFSVADEYVGDEMDISIVKVARYFGTLGMIENEEWLNLLFVAAPLGATSCLLTRYVPPSSKSVRCPTFTMSSQSC